MSHIYLILACGNMGITTGDVVIVLALAACWLTACILCLVNLVMTFRVSNSPSFRLTNFLVFVSYIGVASFLFCLPKIITNNDLAGYVGLTLTLAIPFLVIGHFIYLLVCRRRFKHEHKPDASLTSREPV